MAVISNAADDAAIAMERKYTGLRRFNLGMGFLHLIQGILMILISNDTTYPIYTNFLNFDPATFTLQPNPELFYEVPFGIAVVILPADFSRGALLPGNDWLQALCGQPEEGHEPGALL